MNHFVVYIIYLLIYLNVELDIWEQSNSYVIMVDVAVFDSHLKLTVSTILGSPGVNHYVTLRMNSNVIGHA